MTDSLTSNPKAELTTTTVVSLPVDEYSRLVEDADKNFGAWVDTNKRWAKTFEENRRLRALVQRAHTIIGIREAAHETHKGKAWLEQATRELNGEPASAVETSGKPPHCINCHCEEAEKGMVDRSGYLDFHRGLMAVVYESKTHAEAVLFAERALQHEERRSEKASEPPTDQKSLAEFVTHAAVYVIRHFGVREKGTFIDAQAIAFDAAANALQRLGQL